MSSTYSQVKLNVSQWFSLYLPGHLKNLHKNKTKLEDKDRDAQLYKLKLEDFLKVENRF